MQLNWTETRPLGLDELEDHAASRYAGLAVNSLIQEGLIRCCVRGCSHWLARRAWGVTNPATYCPEHGISVSASPTYIYRDYRRNFLVGVPLLERIKGLKVESWRLGNERSEDALSWNVFLGLARLGGLGSALQRLTGHKVDDEPELYLWGIRIADEEPRVWERLKKVRATLEEGARIPTEPDIILRVPGRVLALVEAKFGSPNSTLGGKEKRLGNVTEFLSRYPAPEGGVDPLNRAWIGQQPAGLVLEQLCRNVVFAQRLAETGEMACVVNLVRKSEDSEGPESFDKHLSTISPVRYRRATWEDLYRVPVMRSEGAGPLRRYLETKTNRLAKAFAI